MPKDSASLQQSRAIRSLLAQTFGGIPRSVIRAKWGNALDTSVSYQDGRESSEYAGTPFSLSGVGARHGQFSRFPSNVVAFAVNFYTPERLRDGEPRYFDNDLPTVLDPFAGHDSRMSAVFRSGRNYVGHDLSHTFMEMDRGIQKRLLDEDRGAMLPVNAQIRLVEGDSREIDYPPVFDLCLSSPPFYNLEDYGNQEGQLGKLKGGYRGFLTGLAKVIERCYHALKPGAFIAWELNDFTQGGRFYPYAFHGMQLFSRFFALHQVIVIDYGQGFLQSFAQDIEALKLVSKEHSYLVVARKRGSQRKRQDVREDLLKEVDKAMREGRMEHQMALSMPFSGLEKDT